ncbi:MAG: NAD-dependent epimerase/dehydratase family protein [Faecalibacillus sp.]
MEILVIGGSYFLGRVFTMCAHQHHHLTLINRGQYSMSQYDVDEYHFDRHDIQKWDLLKNKTFDVVVDFCAYQKHDIEIVINCLKNNIKHYLYVSTVDVYLRQTNLILDECSPLENRHFQGEIGEYIYQKRLLEDELIETCQKYHIDFCSLRPGNIYGPFNYAPRESLLIKRVIDGLPLFHLFDANAHFQMVYVKDVAKAILLIIEKNLYLQAFNIINNELIDYDQINSILQSIQSVKIENHTLQEAFQQQYPLPYPVYQQEQELYDGKKIENYGFQYTSLKEGLSKTYDAFYPLFHHDET